MTRKTDGNQPEIVEQLRDIPGMSVADTHMVGNGFPDIACGYKTFNYLFEVKVPGRARRLTDFERKWLEAWNGQVAVIESFEDACRIMGVL